MGMDTDMIWGGGGTNFHKEESSSVVDKNKYLFRFSQNIWSNIIVGFGLVLY